MYFMVIRFYRVGGGTRFAGFLLAIFTALLLLVGTSPIGYIREWPFRLPLFVLNSECV